MPDTTSYTESGAREDAPVLRAEGVRKSFAIPGGALEVLKGVDLELRAGDLAAVTGISGSGKSTLLHILGGLDRPTEGHVELSGRDLARLPDDALARLRNSEIGYVFQFHHLLPEFSARENVAIPALMAGVAAEEALERADALLAQVGLSERADHRPGRLSGGEQQRVAVARALTNRPRVVLADEPSGNLDRASSEALHDLIWSLNEAEGQAFLLVTHDAELAKRAGRVLELSDGRLHAGS